MPVPTPHIAAREGEIAKTVLMPGDPLRAKFIGETYLDSPVLVNNIRGVQGYTGRWKGTPVTVMASGMGIPSMGVYSWELFSFYRVENILRIGSAGALQDDLHLRDIVFAQGACTDSNFAHQFGLLGTFAPIGNFDLLQLGLQAAREHGASYAVGNVLSSDHFYGDQDGTDPNEAWRKMGVLAVEMEAAGLYLTAARLHRRALCLCTVSDHLYRPEAMSAQEREQSLTQMIEIALDTAVAAEALPTLCGEA